MSPKTSARIQTFFSNRWFLAQSFLAIAAACGWNILGLAILLERHKYLHTLAWWGIVLVLGACVFVAILGWAGAILSSHPQKTRSENLRRLEIRGALWTGGAAFGLGWLICIWLMLRLMNNEPWCLVGALGSMIGDWLPTGLIIAGLTIVISWLSSRWFVRTNPETQIETDD